MGACGDLARPDQRYHYLPMLYAVGLQEEGDAVGLYTKASLQGRSRCAVSDWVRRYVAAFIRAHV